MPPVSYPLTIVILGLEQAGKTTLLRTIMGKKFEQTLTTIGMNVELISYKGYTIQAIDIGGQQVFRDTLWSQYASLAKGIIFVFDIYDEAKAREAKFWFYETLKWASSDATIAFFANKIDLKKTNEDFMSIDKIIQLFELDKLSTKSGQSFQIFEVSAKTGENVEQAMNWFLNKITSRIKERTNISFVLLFDKENRLIYRNTLNDEWLPYEIIETEIYARRQHQINTSKLEFSGISAVIKIEEEFCIVVGTKGSISYQDLYTIASTITETIKQRYTPLQNYLNELDGVINTLLLKLVE